MMDAVMAWFVVGLLASSVGLLVIIASLLARSIAGGRVLEMSGALAVGVAGAYLSGLLLKVLLPASSSGFWDSVFAIFLGGVTLVVLLRVVPFKRRDTLPPPGR
jgi:hypothetical protein